jgi:hypothetical protein
MPDYLVYIFGAPRGVGGWVGRDALFPGAIKQGAWDQGVTVPV